MSIRAVQAYESSESRDYQPDTKSRYKELNIDESNIIRYRKALVGWWLAGNTRNFSWRQVENRTPYRALIAEIMLRRTRASQVEPVYNAFIILYPTLEDAAAADVEALRRVLYPLGLNWRIDNFISLISKARDLSIHDIEIDTTRLLDLPGVGDYVSKAVLCFTENKPVALIDTNVVRVISRVFGLDASGEARRRNDIRSTAEAAMDKHAPAQYHYALLDFAALVCTIKHPCCDTCPIGRQNKCAYALCQATLADKRHKLVF